MNALSMRKKLKSGRVAFCMVLLSASTVFAGAADKQTQPLTRSLILAAQQTTKKISETPASWKVRYRMRSGSVMEAKVVRDQEQQAWSFFQFENGARELVSRIVAKNGIWHVEDAQQKTKCRPYEAELHLPGGYLLLALAELRCVQNEGQFAGANFESRQGNIVSYRLPLASESRTFIEKAVAGLEQIQKQDPTYPIKPETVRALELMREQLLKGTPLSVDETTGLLTEFKMQDLLISIEDFKWLKKTSDADFALPNKAKWKDQTRPWSNKELEDCVMVGRDPLFEVGNKKPAIDSYLLNVRSGEMRRLPYEGITSQAGCFLKERNEVIVSGFDVNGFAGLVRVNLKTGANTAVHSDLARGRISMDAVLSPNGKMVASMQMSGAGQMLEFQIRLINLSDGDSRLLGKPQRIGAPFSWSPDGDSLILKRFEHVDDLRAVDPRILCRMDLDGNLTDLRAGDWPVVLHKTRKILYQDDKTDLWHTCELDGTKPRLFADGLPNHGQPAVSPDESKVIFARVEKGKLPPLILFEMGKSQGKEIVKAPGWTGLPVWR
jgi:hypothetical protein